MKPYTYYIHWSAINKSYYGVKFGKDANPDTFWKDYFTSSPTVKAIREQYGEPDVIQIRKTFDDPQKAYEYETKVLTRLNVIHKEEWLNKGIGGRAIMTEEVRKKISESHKGLKLTEEHKQNIGKGLKGKPKTEAHKESMRKAVRKPALKVECPCCGIMITKQNLARHLKKTGRIAQS